MPNADILRHFLSQATHYSCPTEHVRNEFLGIKPSREAAVLIAIINKDEQWQIILTKRAATLNHHTGQIAFAGGGKDPQDTDLTQTALRETWEEIGIAPTVWQTFPVLPPHYTPSGYTVYPVPALHEGNPAIQASADEVAEIIYLPLDFALDLSRYTTRQIRHDNQFIDVPALPYLHHDIWGLTAMILYSLADRYRQYKDAV